MKFTQTPLLPVNIFFIAFYAGFIFGCQTPANLSILDGQSFVNEITVASYNTPFRHDVARANYHVVLSVEMKVGAILDSGARETYDREMKYVLYTPGCGISARLACAYFYIEEDEFALDLVSKAIRSDQPAEAAWVALESALRLPETNDKQSQLIAVLRQYCELPLYLAISSENTWNTKGDGPSDVIRVGKAVISYLRKQDPAFVKDYRRRMESTGAKWPFDSDSKQ